MISPSRVGQRKSSHWLVSSEYTQARPYVDIPLNDTTRTLVDHMKVFYRDYQAAVPDQYWHRKSGQVVLAILQIRSKGELHHIRGINSELSLPSGSICAERAAISSALSQFLSISRSDFVSVAVLSPRKNGRNPIRPCGVCLEWIRKIEKASPTFNVVTFNSSAMDIVYVHYPAMFEEVEPPEEAVPLYNRWTCSCGYGRNTSAQARCSQCSQWRYCFHDPVRNTRIKLLGAIRGLERWTISGQRVQLSTCVRNCKLPQGAERSYPTGQGTQNNQLDKDQEIKQSCFLTNLSKHTGLSAKATYDGILDLLSLGLVEKVGLNRECDNAQGDRRPQRLLLSIDDASQKPTEEIVTGPQNDAPMPGMSPICHCCNFSVTTAGCEFLSNNPNRPLRGRRKAEQMSWVRRRRASMPD